MDLTLTLSFIVAATLLVISPGPNGVLIARTVPTSGQAAGTANIFGFITAFYIHGALSVFGISVILVQSAEAFFIVKMLGAAYLFWIGGRALFDTFKGQVNARLVTPSRNRRSLFSAFGEGFFTNLLNPKVSMFYLAAFPQFISSQHQAFETALILVSLHCVINAIWFSIVVVLFGRLTRAANNATFQRWLKGITGIVFLGFGLRLATLKP